MNSRSYWTLFQDWQTSVKIPNRAIQSILISANTNTKWPNTFKRYSVFFSFPITISVVEPLTTGNPSEKYCFTIEQSRLSSFPTLTKKSKILLCIYWRYTYFSGDLELDLWPNVFLWVDTSVANVEMHYSVLSRYNSQPSWQSAVPCFLLMHCSIWARVLLFSGQSLASDQAGWWNEVLAISTQWQVPPTNSLCSELSFGLAETCDIYITV